MDPVVKAYFRRIIFSLFVGLLWMALNSTYGIMYNYAFIEDRIRIGNICFYAWFIVSLTALLWFYVWLWKKPLQ